MIWAYWAYDQSVPGVVEIRIDCSKMQTIPNWALKRDLSTRNFSEVSILASKPNLIKLQALVIFAFSQLSHAIVLLHLGYFIKSWL